MKEIFTRTEMLIGEVNLAKLQKSHVIVFGVGGVGGHCIEALARAGVGEITIVDKDVVDITNINRQIIATRQTIGRSKVEVMKERLYSIDKDIKVNDRKMFYLPDKSEAFDFASFSYVVDAIDNVTAKLDIIEKAKLVDTPVISSMGMGNKLKPQMLEIEDIHKTSICPLSKVMRSELKKRGVKGVKVVYSKEIPVIKSTPPGSISFVPSAAGLIMAGEVISDLIDLADR